MELRTRVITAPGSWSMPARSIAVFDVLDELACEVRVGHGT
jgi:hypothetical protein